MQKRFEQQWLTLSLENKLRVFAGMLTLTVCISAVLSIGIMSYSLNGFGEILRDNLKCQNFQEAIELEALAFEQYVKEQTEEHLIKYEQACTHTRNCVSALPFDYKKIGTERYARTWNIKNGYEGYSEFRDNFIAVSLVGTDFVNGLYQIYDQQTYLKNYARRLVQATAKSGNASYQMKVPVFSRMPKAVVLIACLMLGAVVWITKLLSETLLRPVLRLSDMTRRIADNDFSGEDIVVENQDEMGELVKSFNVMKRATQGYINTLKENQEVTELLHREELERMEMEKQLEEARLDALKSQINPHFLFNTLNMIAGMAELEDAETTERLIASMSSLFRYNLSTTEQIVPLRQEMKVVEHYMYLQQMRFGSRVRYQYRTQLDEEKVMIPSFTLQPIVENAIIHGLARKELGGMVFVRIWRTDKYIKISVADTGVGIEAERCEELRSAMKQRKTARIGIGLGNLYQRIHALYPDGNLELYSKKGSGTVVLMTIPQEDKVCTVC